MPSVDSREFVGGFGCNSSRNELMPLLLLLLLHFVADGNKNEMKQKFHNESTDQFSLSLFSVALPKKTITFSWFRIENIIININTAHNEHSA